MANESSRDDTLPLAPPAQDLWRRDLTLLENQQRSSNRLGLVAVITSGLVVVTLSLLAIEQISEARDAEEARRSRRIEMMERITFRRLEASTLISATATVNDLARVSADMGCNNSAEDDPPGCERMRMRLDALIDTLDTAVGEPPTTLGETTAP